MHWQGDKAGSRGNLYRTKSRSDQKIGAAIAPMMAIGRAKVVDPETPGLRASSQMSLSERCRCVVASRSPEQQQIGRDYFARHLGSDIWIWFADLPADIEAKL
jgi:hypothetical protein